MRIISGEQRGKRLITLEGEAVRPTPDRVKEALFNILQFQIPGRRFLDLFAGSGQIGLEALSRGAESASFVDFSKRAVSVVEQNLQSCGLMDRAKVYNADSAVFIARTPEEYDVAFLDPPYRSGLLQEVLPQVAARMSEGGIIICEHPKEEEVPQSAGEFLRVKEYRYGRILLTAYRHANLAETDRA